MRVLFLALLVAGVFSVSDEQWRQTFNEISACTFWTGYCQGKTGDFPHVDLSKSTPSSCVQSSGTWVKTVGTWIDLKQQSAAAAQGSESHFLARLPAKLTIGGADSVIRCGEHTYGIFDGPERIPSESTWHFALPRDFKIAPTTSAALNTAGGSHASLAFLIKYKGSVDEIKQQSWMKKGEEEGTLEVRSSNFLRLSNVKDASSLDESIQEFANSPNVEIIEFEFQKRSLNEAASGITQSNSHDRVVWDHGLHGEDQVVHIIDDGLDMTHCYFSDSQVSPNFVGDVYVDLAARKIVAYKGFADQFQGGHEGHGTHVSGSVLGRPESDPNNHNWGMAYNAKGVFFDIGVNREGSLHVPENLREDLFPFGRMYGARIHTNSWGANYNGYTSDAVGVDKYSFENQENVILVAAGNSGDNGMLGTMGAPGVAKNALTVGASAKLDGNGDCPVSADPGYCQESLADFTSLGPRFDGGIKPDIVAPGNPIYSANSNSGCGLVEMSGTSMATPVVAGNIALVRQYFTEGWYPSGLRNAGDGFEPMGALLKAMIINSGRYLTGKMGHHFLESYPSVLQGFGAVHLNRSLYFEDASRHSLYVMGDNDNMPQFNSANDEPMRVGLVAGNQGNLKVTLVWHDKEASEFSQSILVNDLDLEVKCESCARVSYPNNLQQADRINNVEQVEMHALSPGECVSVSVSPHIIAVGPQPYSLVISGDFEVKAPGEMCFACSEGEYTELGNPNCQPCPLGTTSHTGAQGVGECFCEKGTYGNVVSQADDQCQPCPAGTTTDVTMVDFPAQTISDCVCAMGFYGSGHDDCQSCTDGVDYASSTGQTSCSSCSSCPSDQVVLEECSPSMNTVCKPMEGAVRLMDGSFSESGRVEVYHDGAWGTICGGQANFETANTVCSQLGLPQAQMVTRDSCILHIEGYCGVDEFDITQPIWMTDVFCHPEHSTLAECPFEGWGANERCSSSTDMGVVCGCEDPEQIRDCSGQCVPDTRGNGVCDFNLFCKVLGYDNLDCLDFLDTQPIVECDEFGSRVTGSLVNSSFGQHIYPIKISGPTDFSADSCSSTMSSTALVLFDSTYTNILASTGECGNHGAIDIALDQGWYYVSVLTFGELGEYDVQVWCDVPFESASPTPSPEAVEPDQPRCQETADVANVCAHFASLGHCTDHTTTTFMLENCGLYCGACTLTSGQCGVDNDVKISQLAASVGVEISDCAGALALTTCDDRKYGWALQRYCPCSCSL